MKSELRGFAPIGKLGYRNDGIMGSGKMGIWANGRIFLDSEFNDGKKETLPSYNQHSNIPPVESLQVERPFHYSMCRAKSHSPK